MEHEVYCQQCGDKFLSRRKNAKFCCHDCYVRDKNSSARDLQARKAAEKKVEEARLRNQVPLWKLNEEARRAGMTYGKYQAMLAMKRGDFQ